jgi:hypothetical protein
VSPGLAHVTCVEVDCSSRRLGVQDAQRAVGARRAVAGNVLRSIRRMSFLLLDAIVMQRARDARRGLVEVVMKWWSHMCTRSLADLRNPVRVGRRLVAGSTPRLPPHCTCTCTCTWSSSTIRDRLRIVIPSHIGRFRGPHRHTRTRRVRSAGCSTHPPSARLEHTMNPLSVR